MPWGAIASVVGGILGSEAAGDAADAQIRAGQESNATQMQMYNQNRADMQPWRQSGVNALGRLDAGFQPDGDFNRTFTAEDMYSDPGYNFRLDEGRKNLERSAASRGLLLSGGALKAIGRYGQDYASNEFGNAFNRFQLDQGNRFNRNAAIAGLGQTAVQQMGQMGSNVAQSIGQTQQGMGNARASGYVGGTNALAGGFAGAQNNYFSNQLLARLPPIGGGGGGRTYSAPWSESQPEYGY